MLFFKEIQDKKMADPAFKAFYDKECHICALTLEVIEQMEQLREEIRTAVLNQLEIISADYDALKDGDHCHPEQVARLCRYLNIQTDTAPACHRL